jgi:hypothetical protein
MICFEDLVSLLLLSLHCIILIYFHSTPTGKTSGHTLGDIITERQTFGMTDFIFVFQIISDQQYCSALFLGVSQAFDKVWHQGLLLKIKQTLPPVYFNLLKSYLQNRYFVTIYSKETSPPYPLLSGVPQGSILGPLLYTIYTADIPQSDKTILSTFADDTAIFTTHPDPT